MSTERNTKDMQAVIQAAIAGDRDAFGVLYDEYFTPVYRYVFYRVSSKDDAEEITQDVFMKAFSAFSRYEIHVSTPLPYFYTIAKHAVIDHYKKKRTVRVDEEMFDMLPDTSMDTSREAIKGEEVSALKKALAQLPDDQREALELRFFEDLSGREVASIMSKTEEAVRQLQSRGLKALRSHYDKTYEQGA